MMLIGQNLLMDKYTFIYFFVIYYEYSACTFLVSIYISSFRIVKMQVTTAISLSKTRSYCVYIHTMLYSL